jgi:hypothetical protein
LGIDVQASSTLQTAAAALVGHLDDSVDQAKLLLLLFALKHFVEISKVVNVL